jgi:excisionase family DNA binding protein
MTQWINTKQAMQILGVGSTTIKRWANENRLPYIRTSGGHRRFNLQEVENIIGHKTTPPKRDILSPALWVSWLTCKADVTYIRDLIVKLHEQLGDWFEVADFLGQVTELLGTSWDNNNTSMLEEHIASAHLDLALSGLATSIRPTNSAPTCMLATLSGEQHTVGLSLAHLCLRSAGFKTYWAGANTPIEELVYGLEYWSPSVIALSASKWSTDSGDLAKGYRYLASACQARDIELILGGSGSWPIIDDHGARYRSYIELRTCMEDLAQINHQATVTNF